MPDEIPAASAAPDTSSSSSGTAPASTPAASSTPNTSPDLATMFTQAEQAAPASPDPSAPGVPATQGQAPATQGEGPQTTAPNAPVDGVTPPAGETPAAAAPPAETPQAPAPAEPNPQLVAAQQELEQLRAQSELHEMAAELRIHPAQIPAWGKYANDMGFGTDIRAAFEFNEEVNASKSRIAENEAALIAPYVDDGYSEDDAKAAIKPMQDQFARTEQMLVENKRVAETNRLQLEAMRATEARVQQEGIVRERNEAVQYASQKWGATELPKNLSEIFAGSPAESIRALADDVETLFQSRLASEKSKWAASYQERANTPAPMGANSGAAPASNPLANAATNAPDLATMFDTNYRNGSVSAFG